MASRLEPFGQASTQTADAGAPDIAAYFRQRIVEWAAGHGRRFPWRDTRDPYRLLLAEMMLRRTRAQQVVPVYLKFLDRFPSVAALAAAPAATIQELLAPLGLSWRVPAFKSAAELIMTDHGGAVPRDRDDLLTLPGVGDYVASAIRCFAWDEPVALVDTNTVRVAGRYFGFSTHAESRRRRSVRDAVLRLVDEMQPRESNLAMLDLAAAICRPRNPACGQCPVARLCSFRLGLSENTAERSSISPT